MWSEPERYTCSAIARSVARATGEGPSEVQECGEDPWRKLVEAGQLSTAAGEPRRRSRCCASSTGKGFRVDVGEREAGRKAR